MSRSITIQLLTESTSEYFRPTLFVDLGFDSGTVYVHDGIGTLTFGGNNYLGVGDFGGIETIEEGKEISPFKTELRLSGLDSSMMDEVINQDFYLRPVKIYIGALNESGTLVADPDQIWAGKMDIPDISVGKENFIKLTCESDMAIFDRKNGKNFSDSQQQNDFTEDLFFQFMKYMEDAKIVWNGKETTQFGRLRSPINISVSGRG